MTLFPPPNAQFFAHSLCTGKEMGGPTTDVRQNRKIEPLQKLRPIVTIKLQIGESILSDFENQKLTSIINVSAGEINENSTA